MLGKCSVAFQLNPDRLGLKLSRSFVALAYQEGDYNECQRQPESGVRGEGYPS
jgi:hypothetical protein